MEKKKDRNRFVFGHRLRPIKNNNKPKERKKFVLTKKSYIHNNKPVGGKHSNDELMTQNRKKKQRELDRQKRVKLKEERLQERISLEFDKVQEEQRHIVNEFKRLKILIVKKRVSKKEATKFPNKLTRDMKYSSRNIPEMLLEKNEDLKNSFESYEVLYDKFSEKINSLREDAAKKQEMGQSSTKKKLRKEKIKYKRLLELSIKDAKQRIDDEVNDIYKSPSKWARPDELLNNLILKPLIIKN